MGTRNVHPCAFHPRLPLRPLHLRLLLLLLLRLQLRRLLLQIQLQLVQLLLQLLLHRVSKSRRRVSIIVPWIVDNYSNTKP